MESWYHHQLYLREELDMGRVSPPAPQQAPMELCRDKVLDPGLLSKPPFFLFHHKYSLGAHYVTHIGQEGKTVKSDKSNQRKLSALVLRQQGLGLMTSTTSQLRGLG